MGYVGKPSNLVIESMRFESRIDENNSNNLNIDKSYQYNDFRGIFAFGEDCPTLYIGWHGSC